MRSLRVSRSILRSLLATGLACLLAWPSVAAAQTQPSLAEIARKEAERRKTVKDTKKVITAKDLPESARKPAQAPAPGQAGTASPGEQKPAQTGETAAGGQGDEASWRNRITQAREALARNEAFAAALQSQLNGLSQDYGAAADNFARAKVGEQRDKALAEMQRVRTDIELSKKQIADIEEEARKAGVPPGWLR
jgi:hypothetical protein